MKICVFCSANQQIDPEFFTMTEELGKWAAKNGHTIVYGGVNQGLMECVGKAAKENGGRTIGIVPTIVENGSWAPTAGKVMRSMIEGLKDCEIVEPMVTIRSRMKAADEALLEQLADSLLS